MLKFAKSQFDPIWSLERPGHLALSQSDSIFTFVQSRWTSVCWQTRSVDMFANMAVFGAAFARCSVKHLGQLESCASSVLIIATFTSDVFFSSSSHKVAASVVQFASSFGTMIVAVHLKLLILAPCPRLFLAFCKACEELTTPLVAPIAECYLMLDRGISSSKLRLLSISHLFDPFFLESLKVQPSKE